MRSNYFVALCAGFFIITLGGPKQANAATAAYWRFEEGTAGAAATGSNDILDSSGNGNNGTAINSPLYSSNVPVSTIPQTGAANKLSMDFNGTNQRIAIPDSSSLQLTQSLTLEAYIDPFSNTGGGTNNYKQIVFRGDDRAGLDPYFLAQQNGNAVFEIDNSSDNIVTLSAPLPGINQWTFVAATLDNATGTMDLYINGTLAATKNTSVRPLGALDPSENPGVGIGSLQSNLDNQYFNGLIDEVRISNTALSPNQMLDVPEPSGVVLLAAASFLLIGRSMGRALERVREI